MRLPFPVRGEAVFVPEAVFGGVLESGKLSIQIAAKSLSFSRHQPILVLGGDVRRLFELLVNRIGLEFADNANLGESLSHIFIGKQLLMFLYELLHSGADLHHFILLPGDHRKGNVEDDHVASHD